MNAVEALTLLASLVYGECDAEITDQSGTAAKIEGGSHERKTDT